MNKLTSIAMKTGVLVVCIISLSFFACEKDVNVKGLPEVPTKLVIHGYLNPADDVIRVCIGKTRPVFSAVVSQVTPTTDADVVLSDGSSSVKLNYDAGNDCYSCLKSEMSILPGSTYSIDASTPDGLSAHSSCTVPSALINAIINVTFDSLIGPYDEIMYVAKFTLMDVANEEDYYRIRVNCVAEEVDSMAWRGSEYTMTMVDGKDMISDKNKDGYASELTFQGSFYSELGLDRLEIRLFHVDKNYYLYQNCISGQSQENPFAEPSVVYSNIDGGRGVFSAYTPSELLIINLR